MQEHVSLEPVNTPFLPLSLFSGVAAVKNLAICKTPTLWIKHNIMHINNIVFSAETLSQFTQGDVLPNFLCKIINLVFCVFVVFCLV